MSSLVTSQVWVLCSYTWNPTIPNLWGYQTGHINFTYTKPYNSYISYEEAIIVKYIHQLLQACNY